MARLTKFQAEYSLDPLIFRDDITAPAPPADAEQRYSYKESCFWLLGRSKWNILSW